MTRPVGAVIAMEVELNHLLDQGEIVGEERHVGFNFETLSGLVRSTTLSCDPALLALAVDVSATAEIPDWPRELPWPSSDPRRSARTVVGPVASADVWTQAIDRIDSIHTRFGTLCEDMEAAAIAQIAARYELPYLTIKDISNNERLAQTALITESIGFDPDFPLVEVGRRSAMLLAAVIRRLPEQQRSQDLRVV